MVFVSAGNYISTSNVTFTPYEPNFGDKIIANYTPPPPSVTVVVDPNKAQPNFIEYSQPVNNLIKNNIVNDNIRPKEQTVYSETMPLVPLLVDTAGYYATNYAVYGSAEANDMKDVALFAASDFIALYGFKDYVIKTLAPILGLDLSTANEQLLMDYISDLIAIIGPHMLMNLFVKNEKPKMKLLVGVTGSYIIDKLYMKIMASKVGA